MKPEDYSIWPRQYPMHLSVPRTALWFNLDVAAARYPDRPVTVFYESRLDYARFRGQALALAGHLGRVNTKSKIHEILRAWRSPKRSTV